MISSALLAYVGPGPGLTFFWAFLALMGTIALAVLSLLIWPIRVLIRWIRGTPPTPPQDPAPEASANPDRTTP